MVGRTDRKISEGRSSGRPFYLRCIVLAGSLSQEPSDRPPPQPVVCPHKVLRLGQHSPAVPLKPRNAFAVQRRRQQAGCSCEGLHEFTPKAGDVAELHRAAQRNKHSEPVSGINMNDYLRQGAVQVVAADLDRRFFRQQLHVVEGVDLLQFDCGESRLTLRLPAGEL